jgi:hypothetical protein
MARAPLHEFDGQFPGDPGAEFLAPMLADATKTYPPLQPEASGSLIDTYRTGRIVHVYQDINALAADNTYPYVTYAPGTRPPVRQSIEDVYANILNSPPIPGTHGGI